MKGNHDHIHESSPRSVQAPGVIITWRGNTQLALIQFSGVAYVLCFRNVVIGIVAVHRGLARCRELCGRWSVSKAHQVTALLEIRGHCWLAGFGRLLQITFLFDLPTHCRIPVVLDSVISSAQKYITSNLYKQQKKKPLTSAYSELTENCF